MARNRNSAAGATTGQLLGRLFRGYIRKHLGMLSVAVGAMAVVAATTAGYAWIMQPLVDRVFVAREAGMLIVVPVTVLVVGAIKAVATYVQAYLMGVFGQRIIADIQNSMYAHIIRSDLAFFHNKATGGLLASFLNDANLLNEALGKALTGIAKDSLSLVFLIAVLFSMDWQLALITTVILPIAVLPVRKLGRRMRKASTHNQELTGLFAALLAETFSGARHIKAYGMEGYETGRVAAANETRLRAMFRVIRTRAAAAPMMEMLGGVAVAAVVFYGGSQGLAGRISTGEFFAFITALLLAYQPLKSIANFNTALQEGMAAATRIFAMLDTAPKIRDAADAKPLSVAGGAVSFDTVFHAYADGSPALNGISFEAAPGRTTAIVGPSGAGKSTILNLIPRFYDAAAGRVLIDGQDVRGVTQETLRAAVGLVSQESTLFNDTVRANIAYGRPGAGEEDIAAAARSAAAHDFITELPLGYDTMVGEAGVKLSGGQRQRIAIARAMLKNAPILLLDEATSSLDTESERQVQEALRRLSQGRTTIVVAHRLSTIADADRIFVVDGGRIVEAGSHGELLARRGLYARLYTLQAGGAAAA